MKICFPVKQDAGMDSEVYGHFGSAPVFVVVDTSDNSINVLDNGDLGHEHGKCNPLKALSGQTVQAVIVGGIGRGAVNGLRANGVEVYKAGAASIADNLDMLQEGSLHKFNSMLMCKGHSGSGCAH